MQGLLQTIHSETVGVPVPRHHELRNHQAPSEPLSILSSAEVLGVWHEKWLYLTPTHVTVWTHGTTCSNKQCFFFSILFAIAVQHERKPLLDKKEAAAAAAAAAMVANNSAGTGGDMTGLGAFTSQGRGGSGTNAKYSRNEFISSPTGANMGNLSNLFPVGISFAELTSTLAQRGSKCIFYVLCFYT